jgi:hypothetical protein
MYWAVRDDGTFEATMPTKNNFSHKCEWSDFLIYVQIFISIKDEIENT